MRWKKTDKPCNRVIVKNSKVFECAPEWEVADVYYDELALDVDSITVRFTKTQEICGGKEMSKKYIIELEDKVSENAKGEKLYFVKGFNNLSLDETALKKLTELKEEQELEHEFRVGDVVEIKTNNEKTAKTGIITKTTLDSFYVLLTDGSARNLAWLFKDDTYTLKFIKYRPNTLFGFLTCIKEK